MTPVDQDGVLNSIRPSERADCVHSGAAGSAGEQDIVNENQGQAFQLKRELGFLDARESGTQAEVIAVHRDVDDPGFSEKYPSIWPISWAMR